MSEIFKEMNPNVLNIEIVKLMCRLDAANKTMERMHKERFEVDRNGLDFEAKIESLANTLAHLTPHMHERTKPKVGCDCSSADLDPVEYYIMSWCPVGHRLIDTIGHCYMPCSGSENEGCDLVYTRSAEVIDYEYA